MVVDQSPNAALAGKVPDRRAKPRRRIASGDVRGRPAFSSGPRPAGGLRAPRRALFRDETRFSAGEVRVKQSGAILSPTTSNYRTGVPRAGPFLLGSKVAAAAPRRRCSRGSVSDRRKSADADNRRFGSQALVYRQRDRRQRERLVSAGSPCRSIRPIVHWLVINRSARNCCITRLRCGTLSPSTSAMTSCENGRSKLVSSAPHLRAPAEIDDMLGIDRRFVRGEPTQRQAELRLFITKPRVRIERAVVGQIAHRNDRVYRTIEEADRKADDVARQDHIEDLPLAAAQEFVANRMAVPDEAEICDTRSR
jgi:hypothetical protein